MSFLTSFLNDPAKLEGIVVKAFGMFDKDKSGFIEANEVDAVAAQVCKLAGMTTVPHDKIAMVFRTKAGTDGKLDKKEFADLVTQLFKLVGAGNGGKAH